MNRKSVPFGFLGLAVAIFPACSSTSVTQNDNTVIGGSSGITGGVSSNAGTGPSTLHSGGLASMGGEATIGGDSTTTGGVADVAGGASATLSSADASGGAVTASGGAPATGGTIAVMGGQSATVGGASTLAGGAPVTGGAAAQTGGAPPNGGTLSTGGAVATGGVTVTGGSAAASGSVSTGGSMSTGGSSVIITGGTTATGGAGTGGSCSGANILACHNTCVDISNTPAHCGSCDHDCGGGNCALGVCQSMEIYAASLPIKALAVGRSDVYFATYESSTLAGRLLVCPQTGCTLAPRQVVSMQYPIYSVAWVPDGTTAGIVVFNSAPAQTTERPSLFPCPDTGCVGTPTYAVTDGMGGFDNKMQTVGNKVYYNSQHQKLNSLTCGSGTCTNDTSLGVGTMRPFASDGITEYYIDASPASSGHTGYIYECDLSTTPPCTPTTVLATDVSAAIDIQVVGTTLYWLIPGSGIDGRVRRCTLPSCSSVTDLVKGLNSPKEMLIDHEGAYIINGANVIQRCNGAECVGGLQDWVTGTAVQLLHSDSKFVYWADGNVVRRIAK